jgi:hypothetical protein
MFAYGSDNITKIPLGLIKKKKRIEKSRIYDICILYVITLSILFVGLLESKWYLNRTIKGSTITCIGKRGGRSSLSSLKFLGSKDFDTSSTSAGRCNNNNSVNAFLNAENLSVVFGG